MELNTQALKAVMSTVLYFDIFRHPLTREEIKRYIHHNQLSENEVNECIGFLKWHYLLYERDGFILASPAYENIQRRIKGEKFAEKRWPTAIKKSRLIGKFPFVRSVIISGSLSKGFMDEYSDIDYLIITAPRRLWIARTLLTAYKKIFLLNSHKSFCVNYFLDQENLVLNDRNIFTSTELLFAVPTYNMDLYNEFVALNDWTNTYYPAYVKKDFGGPKILTSKAYMKTMLEKLLSGRAGDYMEDKFRKITVKFWRKKFSSMPESRFNRDMKNTDGVSKHHPNGFRERVLQQHHEMNLHASRQINELLSAETLISRNA